MTSGERTSYKRLIGSYGDGTAGPLLLVLAGIHGNEPAGIVAAQRVLDRLDEEGIPVRGRIAAIAGNLRALREGRRFLREDLNRMWTTKRVRQIRTGRDASALDDEEAELCELVTAIGQLIDGHDGPVIMTDLHSTSGAAPPFSIISDTLQNRTIAFALPMPVVLGLEEAIDGTTLSYFGEMGIIALGIEGGRHQDAETIDNHEAVLWLMMGAAGLLDASMIPDFLRHRRTLLMASGVLPRVVEIIHRHGIGPDDGMVMLDGFSNFQPVTRTTVLARDKNGEIRPPASGLLLLPRYQEMGDDGFFIARPVNPFWLQLSSVLRFLRIDHLLGLFPGVHHHDRDRRLLLADPKIARLFTVQIFHLLGYRRRGMENGFLRFSRRPEKPVYKE